MNVKSIIAACAAAVVMLPFAIASAATPLTVSCIGTSTASSITWTATTTGGVMPVAFAWGNGATTSAQTVAATAGNYSLSIQATDASSSLATSTCTATVAQSVPTITSFAASLATIMSGQSSTLSWVVSNASLTSIDNGVGYVAGNSVPVSPTTTTTYHLTAANLVGTSTASATVTVNGSGSTIGGDVTAQIQALLNQIAALRAQIVQLISQNGGTGGGTTGSATSTCYKFGRNLSFGDNGDDVKHLQQTLAADPTILPPSAVTGFFGKKTEAAVRKFQGKFGVNGTTTLGTFGPKSRAIFDAHCGGRDSDNDGIPDMADPHPFIAASSTGAIVPMYRDHGGNGHDGGDN